MYTGISMRNTYKYEVDILDDVEDEESSERSGKVKSKVRKRKWREIEAIKEQRRLRRDLAYFEHNAY